MLFYNCFLVVSSILFVSYFHCAFGHEHRPPFSAATEPTLAPTTRNPSVLPTLAPVVTVVDSFDAVIDSFNASIEADSQALTWTIQPSLDVNAIQIIFTRFDIGNAELRLYDCDADKQIMNCIQCDDPQPPPFLVNSGCVYITIRGITARSFLPSYISVTYIGQLVSVSDATVAVTSYSVLLESGIGKLWPTVIGGTTFLGGSTQEWRISSPSHKTLTLSLASFSFPDSNNCDAVLKIYDGASLIYSGCKQDDMMNKWLFAASGEARVILTSPTNAELNFLLTWYSDSDVFHCGSVEEPNVNLGQSMIITDGTAISNSMRASAGPCSWVLKPTTSQESSRSAGTVTLIFTEVHLLMLNNNPPVVVRDTDGSTVLWSVKSGDVTDVIPPPLVSSGDTMYVSYSSDPSSAVANYHGFTGSYYGNSNATLTAGGYGEGDDYSELRMSSAISIVSPGDGLTAYPANMSYTWLIEPKSMLSDYITFTFSKLHIVDCDDNLTLYDGTTTSAPVLGTFCGAEPPTQWYKTSGTGALLTFETNGANNEGFFELAYFSDGPNYHCGFSRELATLTANSYTFTDGSSSTQSMYAGERCKWNIAPKDATGITIVFERFDLIGGSLVIYNGPVAEGNVYVTMSNVNAVPPPMYFDQSVVGIQYTSNANGVMGKGFAATYYSESNRSVGPGDNAIILQSSTVHSLRLPTLSDGHIMANKNLSWFITPTTTGKIYFAFTKMNLSDCSRTYVNIYDGLVADPAKLLGKYCGQPLGGVYNSTYTDFIVTNEVSAVVEFVSLNSNGGNTSGQVYTNGHVEDTFELSYYSDGPNNHCGFAKNPGVLTAGSMVLSDGSMSTASMQANQHCQWLINPSPIGNSLSNNPNHRVVLDFLQLDLGGGELRIYNDGHAAVRDGMNESNLLYSCVDCTEVPRSIISNSSSLFVDFLTSDSISGSGFQIVYYTITDTIPDADEIFSNNIRATSDTELVLELPVEFNLDNSTSNETLGFRLGAVSSTSTLVFYPRVELQSSYEFKDYVDGRQAGSAVLTPSESVREICGVVSSTSRAYFADMGFATEAIAGTQYLNQYLHSTSNVKTVLEMVGSWDTSNAIAPSVPLVNSHVCKYVLDSGNNEAIDIVLKRFTGQNGGRLRIYGGVYGSELLLFDSKTQRGEQTNVALDAPCGLATIILENDSNITSNMDYGVELMYTADRTDYAEFKFRCEEYSKSSSNIVQNLMNIAASHII